jgi:hypothetical protein
MPGKSGVSGAAQDQLMRNKRTMEDREWVELDERTNTELHVS